MKPAVLAVSLSLVAALVSTGCSRDSGGSKPLVVVRAVAPATLDPLLLSGPAASDIGPLLFSYLLTTDPSGKLAPDLAVRVPSLANGDIAPDGRTITYRLRRGVRWHDGTPFGARDVVATYRAVMDGRNAVPSRLGFDQVSDVRALGDATVRVRLRAPFAPFLSYFFAAENYPVLAAHALAKHGVLRGTPLDAAPVGTGPYRLRAWRRGELLSLEANPGYFRGAPKIARVDLRFIADPQAAANALRAGDADALLGLDPLAAQELRGDARFALSATPVFGVEELLFQTRDPALRDPAVRRRIVAALHLARDVAAASRGLLDTRDADAGLWTWATLPTTSSAGLAGAGSSPSPRAEPSTAAKLALPAQLTLAYDSTRVLDRILATTVQDDARRAGLSLALRGYAPQQFSATADAHGPLASGAYQLALRSEITGADPETSWLLACDQIPPPAGWNFPRWCEPEVDRALRDGLRTFDQRRRAAAYATIQRRVARDVPFVLLWRTRSFDATVAGLERPERNPDSAFLGVERWRLGAISARPLAPRPVAVVTFAP
jgi:peptide/nickel transport system substrate-binding protein